MLRLIRKLYLNIPLFYRVILSTIVLFISTLLIVVSFFINNEINQINENNASDIKEFKSVIPAMIKEQLIMGDYATVEQILTSYIKIHEFKKVELVSNDKTIFKKEKKTVIEKSFLENIILKIINIKNIEIEIPISVENISYGTIKISVFVEEDFHKSYEKIISQIYLVFIMLAVVLLVLRFTILKPLKSINILSNQLNNINLDNLNIESHDISDSPEIQKLSNSFNSMLETINKNKNDLIKSELLFKELFAKHDSAFLLIHPKTGSILNANISASILYGYSIEELKNLSLLQLNNNSIDSLDSLLELYKSKNKYFILSQKTKENKEIIVELYASNVFFNDSESLFCIIHDITEGYYLKERLKLLAHVFEKAKEGIVITNSKWIIQEVNDFFCEISGYSRNEVIGKHINEFKTNVHDKKIL